MRVLFSEKLGRSRCHRRGSTAGKGWWAETDTFTKGLALIEPAWSQSAAVLGDAMEHETEGHAWSWRLRIASTLTAFIGAVVGSAPGVALLLFYHFTDKPVEVAALLIPGGYVGGIWLGLARRRYLRGGLTAASAVALFIAGVTTVSYTDWPDRGWAGGLILGALAIVATLLAGAIIPGKSPWLAAADQRYAPDPLEPTRPVQPDPPLPAGDLVGMAAVAVGWGFMGAVAGFGVGVVGIGLSGGGGFGAGAIALGIGLVGAAIGVAIGMARASRPRSE